MTNTQRLSITILVLAAVVGGLYYLSTRPSASGPSLTSTTTPNGTATSTATTTANVTGVLATPNYKKPIVFLASVAPEIRTQLNTQLKTVQANLDKNPLSIRDWVNLGSIHKMGGDYAAAAEYWEFIASTYRGPGVPYLSLGDLYENSLHNTTKAETYYKLAIEADPKNVNAYADLYTMYHYTLKDDTKAAAILEQGLKANPGNNYLLSLQQELKK